MSPANSASAISRPRRSPSTRGGPEPPTSRVIVGSASGTVAATGVARRVRRAAARAVATSRIARSSSASDSGSVNVPTVIPPSASAAMTSKDPSSRAVNVSRKSSYT